MAGCIFYFQILVLKTPIPLQILAAAIYGVSFFIFQNPFDGSSTKSLEAAQKSFARLYNRNRSFSEIAMQVRDIQIIVK
jgi:hypothetical protein